MMDGRGLEFIICSLKGCNQHGKANERPNKGINL